MAIEMFKRGSVEMLALLILNEDDAHGYRIVQEIKDRSDGRLIIKEGSLYPILYKLSDEGYIISQEDISSGPGTSVTSYIVSMTYPSWNQ